MKAFLMVIGLGGVLAGVSGVARAQDASSAPRLDDVVPRHVYLEGGGEQAVVLMKGAGLKAVKRAQLWRDGKESAGVLARLGEDQGDKRAIFLSAEPKAALGVYELYVGGGEGAMRRMPVSVELVPRGDPRARQAGVPEKEGKPGDTIVILERDAPRVTGTLPNPLVLFNTGYAQQFILKGENLHLITSVRVRKKAAAPMYHNKQGEIPYKAESGELVAQLMAAPTTPEGEAYVLDLLMKKYIAVSLPFRVKAVRQEGGE